MMNLFERAKDLVKKASEVRVIGHLDADGISATAIILRALLREGKRVHATIVKNLNDEILEKIDGELVIFVDLGSGYAKTIEKYLEKAIILDHHIGEDSNLIDINTLKLGFQENEISGAGITYLFAKHLNPKNIDLAYLAIVGAIGDMQENGDFYGKNKEILKDAIDSGRLEVKRGLKVFGRLSRPLHQALAYSTDIFIPGITGNESGAIQFLSDLGIEVKKGNKWRTLGDLSEEEEKKLITGVALKRLDQGDLNIIGNVYTIKNVPEIISDAREFATILNACGRLEKYGLGIALGLEKYQFIDELKQTIKEYKGEIIKSLNWVYENINTDRVFETDNVFYILGKNDIRDTLIGTVISIINSSQTVTKKPILVGMSYRGDKVKISVRVRKDLKINISEIIKKALEFVGGEGGGHEMAGGGEIKKGYEKDFIEEFDRLINNKLGKKKGLFGFW